MYERTKTNTVGFFLICVGFIGILDTYFEIYYLDTWPIILIALGAYILFLPKRQTQINHFPIPQTGESYTQKTSDLSETVKQIEVETSRNKTEPLNYKTMKALFVSLFGLFAVTAIITHIWTVIIAFTEGGFFSGIVSLLLPFVAELYWMFKMFGENDTYAYISLAHLLLAIPFSLFGRR